MRLLLVPMQIDSDASPGRGAADQTVVMMMEVLLLLPGLGEARQRQQA